MSEGVILSELDGHVLTITMSRPEAKNALTRAMYTAMTEALTEASANAQVRVVVLRGDAGIFTAGNDLNDFMNNPPTDQDSPVFQFLKAVTSFAKPLIASVQGHAIGIGTTILLHCDLAYAADNATFQMPFTRLALVPEAASSLILPAMIGHRRASELLMLSERFGAARALELGFVNEVVSVDELDAKTQEKAQALSKFPPESIRLTKQLLKRHDQAAIDEAMQVEAQLFTQRLQSPELAEAIQAFFQKREPKF